jgi:uncharacterized membrane protein
MPFPRDELVAFLVAVSFAAGLNVYATVATLGLLARFDVLTLPGSLEMLGNEWVIGISATLFVIEFIADKIPMFDLVWNALQTFVRVPVGALLGYAATSGLSPTWQAVATAVGGTVALAAHGGKTAARAAVTPSPEPVSNFLLSLAEDGFAIFITWFATQYPFLAATIVIVFLVIIVLLVRWIVKALAALWRSAMHRLDRPVVPDLNYSSKQ